MITIRQIKDMACDLFGVTDAQLTSPIRQRSIARPRQAIMYAARIYGLKSFPEIGRAFNRDHTTVLHAMARIQAIIDEAPRQYRHRLMMPDPKFRVELMPFLEMVAATTPIPMIWPKSSLWPTDADAEPEPEPFDWTAAVDAHVAEVRADEIAKILARRNESPFPDWVRFEDVAAKPGTPRFIPHNADIPLRDGSLA